MKKKRKKGFAALISRFVIRLVCLFICFTLLQVAAIRFIDPFITPNVAWEWAEAVLYDRPGKRPSYIWKNIDAISPHLRKAVIAAEDQRFLSHSGFDFNEMKNAFETFLKKGRLRGASTISMQAARSVFLLSSRSFARKIAEIYYTILMELFLGKKRILEIYLNTVDWGTGVTGAEAASRKYFGKGAEDLTLGQASLMTAILPNPHRWSAKNPTPYIISRQKKILESMKKLPLIYYQGV